MGVWLTAIAGVLLVGFIDTISGVEIRVFPLYFLPIVLAAYKLGQFGALIIAVMSAIAWEAAMYYGGRHYSHSYTWVVNFFTQGAAFVLIGVLVATIRDAMIRERDLSRTDMLTGLPNSRAFYEEAAHMLAACSRNAQPVTLGYIDLDNFKHANDTLGHAHGDVLLQEVATIIKGTLRASDLVARMGGDEFAVLLLAAAADDATVALEKVRQNIAEAPQLKGSSVTASIGAVSYARVPQVLDAMVSAADNLMYEVKAQGRNRVMFKSMQCVS